MNTNADLTLGIDKITCFIINAILMAHKKCESKFEIERGALEIEGGAAPSQLK